MTSDIMFVGHKQRFGKVTRGQAAFAITPRQSCWVEQAGHPDIGGNPMHTGERCNADDYKKFGPATKPVKCFLTASGTQGCQGVWMH